jgi:MoaA/NifB/PqqE/SkfB family radical SAM enzyme
VRELRLSFHRNDGFENRLATPAWRRTVERLSRSEIVAQLDAAKPEDCRRLTVAGSPLEHPEWVELLTLIRERGFQHIEVETDPAPLATTGRLDTLRSLGVTRLFLLVGGIRRKVHEAVMQDPGSFTDAMKGMHDAIKGGFSVYVVAPLVKWNADDMEPLLQWLFSVGNNPAGFLLALPELDRLSAAAMPLVLPYAKQAEIAENIFKLCQGNRVEYGFFTRRGILPCAAGGHLERFATVFWERIQFMRHHTGDPLVRVPACETCSLAKSCQGAERKYVDQFGAAEMRPIPVEVSSGWKLRKQNSLEDREFRSSSAYANETIENPMALVRINGHCNMSCSFCFIDRTVPDFESSDLMQEIRQLHAGGARHLMLSGGEPTLHPDLAEMIRLSKEMGYRVVEMQSNGVKAADPDYARTLREAGLDEVCLSLHSANPDKSDEITRLPKAFWKTVQGMHNFQELGLETKFAHVITELNYRELPDTIRFLRDEFPPQKHSLSICFGIVQPISDLVFSWVIPRFTEVKAFMKAALDLCMESGIGIGGVLGEGGYPPCMLDGDMKYYKQTLGTILRSEDHESRFYKAPRCRECSFDPYCHGVRADYVELHGDSEIQPFQSDIVMPTRLPPRPPPMVKRAGLVPLGKGVAE